MNRPRIPSEPMTPEERAEAEFWRIIHPDGAPTPADIEAMKKSGIYQRALFHENLVDLGHALMDTWLWRQIERFASWLENRLER